MEDAVRGKRPLFFVELEHAISLADAAHNDVTFGNSFASGMGTGRTSTDKCRAGPNNYGELLWQWFSYKDDCSYEPLSCLGDTIDGANSQIAQ
jgi:hypothetical protein